MAQTAVSIDASFPFLMNTHIYNNRSTSPKMKPQYQWALSQQCRKHTIMPSLMQKSNSHQMSIASLLSSSKLPKQYLQLLTILFLIRKPGIVLEPIDKTLDVTIR